jgi:hypothetical protein
MGMLAPKPITTIEELLALPDGGMRTARSAVVRLRITSHVPLGHGRCRRFEYFKEGSKPRWMGWPRWRGHEVTVNVSFGPVLLHVAPTCGCHFGSTGRIG